MPEETSPLRVSLYWLIIVAVLGTVGGRIIHVADKDGKPFLSANDRSRWATIRALGDSGTYEIDTVIASKPRNKEEREDPNKDGWDSIDKVRHRGADGRDHFYSSKPPLLPTLVAGPYWVMAKTTGARMGPQTSYVVRTLLLLINLPMLALMLWTLSRVVDVYGKTDWAKVLVMVTAGFACLTTTFAVTLNNHLPAALSVMLAIYAGLAIWRDEKNWGYFVLAGFSAAFAVANELPALSFFAILTGVIAIKSPLKWALGYLPAAAVVAGAFFYTNHLAHDSWRPPYMHRHDGDLIAKVEGNLETSIENRTLGEILEEHLPADTDLTSATVQERPSQRGLAKASESKRYVLETASQRFALAQEESEIAIYEWDNWYDYEGTYWRDGGRAGVDVGEPSRGVYFFHMMFGHHGWFSLTPIWLLAVLGIYFGLTRPELRLRACALLTLILFVVVVAFYFLRPEIDRNYGGVSCGMRWFVWLIPLWLICLLPAADFAASRKWLRVVSYALLGLSVMGATYNAANPWTHPWIFDYWSYLEWISY